MNRTITAIVCLSAALSLTAFASTSHAGTMIYTGSGYCSNLRIIAPDTLANGQTVAAGQELFTYNGVSYAGYCVDINHYSGSSDVVEVGLADYVAAQNKPAGYANAAAYLFNTYAAGVSSGLEAAALQSAIWEVLFESDVREPLDVTTGYFQIADNADVATRANQLLATIPGGYVPTSYPTVVDSANQQDFMMIPEPATLCLVLAGGALALRRERRWQAA